MSRADVSRIAIFGNGLSAAYLAFHIRQINGRSAMSTISSHQPALARTAVMARRIEAAALYGAFALIGAVVFGTLSIHPF